MYKNSICSLPQLREPPPIKKSTLLKQISTEKDPPIDSIEDIRGYVEMFKTKHNKELVLNKHEKASEIHNMMTTFSNNAQRSLFNRKCKNQIGFLQNKLETTKTDETKFDEESTETAKTLETSSQRRWDRMKQRHSEEMEALIKKRPMDTPANFRRRSPELLLMMRQERQLFMQSRFAESTKLREECERKNEQEAKEQYDAALRHWDVQKSQLEEKQKREESVMLEWIKQRRLEYAQDKEKQLEAMAKRKEILKTEIKGKSNLKRCATPHLIRRNICFENRSKSRGLIESTPITTELDKLYSTLSERSHQILQQKL